MPHSVVYYVSGHGYGHARRAAEVIRALRADAPDVNVYVRTAAPAEMFRGLVAGPVVPSHIDAPVVERDPLSIDWPATLAGAADLLRRRRAAVGREVDALRELAPSLVVADVPFLAGDVAAGLGVPCVAVSNFTWDWVFEPHRSDHPDGAAVVRGVRSSYAQMAALLQLPFGHDTDVFPQVIPVPLVARRATMAPPEVMRRLGLDGGDDRPRVLVGMRGGVAGDALERAGREAPDYLFLRLDRGDATPVVATNVRPVRLEAGLDFSDLLSVTDVVLSKLGYGMIADCIAAGTRLVWPPRAGFREDEVTKVQAPRFLRMAELSAEFFRGGQWLQALDQVMALPEPPERMPVDGAAACARVIAGGLAGS
jgi:UDP:flavonoid glycosyltransferase YjiC (YdhE family)